MILFFHDLQTSTLLANGLIAGLLASVACGVVGPYVVARRIVFLAGAIAHLTLGGVGAAIFLRTTCPQAFAWLTPLLGALLAAIIAAVVMAMIHDRMAERLDTLIGATWAVGMAAGLMLIKFTPGYHVDLMTYLFGNIAVVSRVDVYLMIALSAVIVVMVGLLHRQLLAMCLDPQYAALQGVRVRLLNTALLVLVALAVVCLMQVVGLILVIALLTLPAATAGHHLRRLSNIMIASTLLCALLTVLPRAAVYGSRVSPESAIVLAAGGVYLLSVIIVAVRRRLGPA